MHAIPFRYNLRSLRVRIFTTLLTVGGVALVVSTFVALMALAAGLQYAIGGVADPRNAVLLYRGGISETMSRVTVEAYQSLRFLPHIARNAREEPLASLESLVQINLERKSGGETMVVMRGLRPIGFEVHDKVHLIEGQPFRPQSGCCIVGKGIRERHVGMDIGGTLKIGNRGFKVVGVFEADGGSMESEIWADLEDTIAAAHRDWYNSVGVKLREASLFESFSNLVKTDPRIDLSVKSEAQYIMDQAEGADSFRIIGLLVAFFMAIGASLAEMNTMYAAVSSRTREIGTLRALGYSRHDVLLSFLAESVILAVPGGILGCAIGSMANGFKMSVLSLATVSEVSFQFAVTPNILVGAFLFSIALGLLGGMLPAVQAARMPVLEALRKV